MTLRLSVDFFLPVGWPPSMNRLRLGPVGATITLNVSNMTCVTCPLTVKLALTKVEGVSKAAVDFDKKEAVVTFDDAKTNVAALIKATTDAGYPSAVKQTEKK